MPGDLSVRRDDTLGGSKRKRSVTHLGGLVSICVARLLRLTFDGHAVFQRLQNSAGPTDNLHVLLDTTGDFDVCLTRDARGHFDKSDFVTFDNVNTLLRLWLLTI